MADLAGCIYSSGQSVLVSGTYEVVGLSPAGRKGRESAIRNLQQGEFFPTYEGWEVCWHLISSLKPLEPDKSPPRARF